MVLLHITEPGPGLLSVVSKPIKITNFGESFALVKGAVAHLLCQCSQHDLVIIGQIEGATLFVLFKVEKANVTFRFSWKLEGQIPCSVQYKLAILLESSECDRFCQ